MNFPNLGSMKNSRIIPLGLAGAALCSCQATTGGKTQPLRAMNERVDVNQFMGDWYVIAHIPTLIEKEAYNAIESYELAPDGKTIPTTFRFNKGSFDGPVKTYRPKGFIYNHETNAEWRMQFVWPFKASYLITYLSEDKKTTIIGVPGRRYAWIMSRSKTLSPEYYAELVRRLEESGHDISKLRKVPQR